MFRKVLEYTGEFRKTTYCAIVVILSAGLLNALSFFFIYQILSHFLGFSQLSIAAIAWRVGACLLCVVMHAVLYIKGLMLSHMSAYHTLENLRLSLQGKLEKLPLGVIQEKGTGTIKKMFVEDIDDMELLLAHALPEGFANLTIPLVTLAAMFFVDWKLGLLCLCALPIGLISIMVMYKQGTGKMNDYYQSARKMNNTIIEYINGMEVVKVFNRDGESYHRYETDIKSYRCLLYTSPSPRDVEESRMPSSA